MKAMAKKFKKVRRVFVSGKWYRVVLHKAGNEYWIDYPKLHGCVSQGGTIKEALIMIKDAIKDMLRFGLSNVGSKPAS